MGFTSRVVRGFEKSVLWIKIRAEPTKYTVHVFTCSNLTPRLGDVEPRIATTHVKYIYLGIDLLVGSVLLLRMSWAWKTYSSHGVYYVCVIPTTSFISSTRVQGPLFGGVSRSFFFFFFFPSELSLISWMDLRRSVEL